MSVLKQGIIHFEYKYGYINFAVHIMSVMQYYISETTDEVFFSLCIIFSYLMKNKLKIKMFTVNIAIMKEEY